MVLQWWRVFFFCVCVPQNFFKTGLKVSNNTLNDRWLNADCTLSGSKAKNQWCFFFLHYRKIVGKLKLSKTSFNYVVLNAATDLAWLCRSNKFTFQCGRFWVGFEFMEKDFLQFFSTIIYLFIYSFK